MKNTNKIVALLLIWLLSISSAYANWFPEEPMVIYGDITWNSIEGKTLEILDWDNNVKAKVTITDNKYWTNKTFELDKKININPFDWELKFQISGYKFLWLTKWETQACEYQTIFQKWNICEYNLSFEKIVYSSGGGWGWGGWSSSYSSSSNDSDSSSSDYYSTDKTDSSNNWTDSSESNEDEGNVKRNINWKIIISSKDYIKAVNNFQAKKKETKTILWLKVINIKWDDSFNKNVLNYVKEINSNIQLDWIRKSMAKHLDKMTKTYWMYTDSELDENLKDTFKAKLKEDREYFEFKMKILKRKDEIIRYNLAKRNK